MIRTVLGTRQLTLTIKAAESVAVTAKLTRGGKTVATRKATLATGTRTLKVTIPGSTKAGAAKLKLSAQGRGRQHQELHEDGAHPPPK